MNIIWPLKTEYVVVVVDDDPDVLRSLTFALEVDGFKVRAYANAEDLLADGPPPELGCLVIDQKLQGMDGLTLLERLREQGCLLPALLISTPSVALTRRAAAAGVPILEKPLLTDRLLGTVRGLVGVARAEGTSTIH